MMRVFAVTTAKSMPVTASLVLLLLVMLWPFQCIHPGSPTFLFG